MTRELKLRAVALLASLACPLAAGAQERALTLRDAQARLESGNREIVAARRALDLAASGVVLAGAVANPVLSASVSSINLNRGIGSGALHNRQLDSILHIDQLVERGGKRELRMATADALTEAARRDLAEVRRQQRLAMALAYYDLKLSTERLRVLGETSRLHAQSVQAAERRLAAGDASQSEVVRLRVEALRAENDARAAEGESSRARQALALMLGDSPDALLVPADDWPEIRLPADAAAPLDPAKVQMRPDVRAAQARVDSAERARELARRLRTRDVTVGAQVERFPPEPGVSFGFNVAVPLFVRYQFEGEIAQAEASLTAAMAARDRQAALALAELRRAQTDLASAAERRRRLTEDLLPQARRSLESAEFAYQRGALGLLDLLDARRTLRALELEAAASAADFAKARAAWIASSDWETATP